MTALRRVLRSPGLVLGLWLATLAVGLGTRWLGRMIADSGVEPFAPVGDGPLHAVAELLSAHPPVGAALGAAAVVMAIGSAVAWTLVAPAALLRLAGSRSRSEIASRWLATVPAVVATSLWHLLLRAGALLALLVLIAPLGPAVLLVAAALVSAVSAFALDRARVRVVLEGAGGLHPRTAVRAYADVLHHPRTVAAVAGLWLGQVALAALVAWMGMRAVDPAHGLGWGRIAAGVAIVLGLWRWAVVLGTSTAEASVER